MGITIAYKHKYGVCQTIMCCDLVILVENRYICILEQKNRSCYIESDT